MGTQERKARERRQRVNDIVEAARRIFERKGFLNTTLQDVAKEAEISVGLIYRYFQSKEDIFAALALKGAEVFDDQIEDILKKASTGKRKKNVAVVLGEITDAFFNFYEPYGEYFDLLMYSYKGRKQVQIHGTTLTRLMAVTLSSLDRIKEYIVESPEFRAHDEDEALQVVFLLWGLLLGCHKLFDNSGRGHLFAFRRSEFVDVMIRHVFLGLASDEAPVRNLLKSAPLTRSRAQDATSGVDLKGMPIFGMDRT